MIEERIKGAENSKSTRVTDVKGAKVKQWLHDFLSHPWVELQGGCRRRRRPCGMRKTEDHLEAEPLPLSKIRDGSAERNGRPRGAAVFDF